MFGFGVWCLVFGFWCLVFGSFGLVFGVWCLLFLFNSNFVFMLNVFYSIASKVAQFLLANLLRHQRVLQLYGRMVMTQ